MLLIVGTVPDENIPLVYGEAYIEQDKIAVNKVKIPISQGSSAMIGAAIKTLEHYKQPPPNVLIAGDIGSGCGSKLIYHYLVDKLPELSPDILALHYILPIMGLMKKVLESVEKCNKKPILIADAGSMYAATAGKMAEEFDLFTPDLGELSFLADEKATHPAYINKHLFNPDITEIPKLIEMAYQNDNAAKLLLVKGSTDFIVLRGKILNTIAKPNIPALEAVGGTGDTLTGLVSAFTYAGFDLRNGAVIAARANRMTGEYTRVTPATKISEIINQFPSVFKALKSYIKELI